MTRKKLPRVPQQVLAELEGLNWELRLGSKHYHLTIDGNFIGILPLGGVSEGSQTSSLAMRAQVRRYKQSRYAGFRGSKNFGIRKK